jgi:uncharacterized damage-inducible protein DinB
MTPSLPSPSTASSDPSDEFTAYLDFYRDAARRKVADLDHAALHTSRVPSGWSPAELVSHLVHMERRWLVWGFLGEPIDDPWGDHAGGDESGRWATERTTDDLLTALDDGGRRTSEIISTHDLLERATTGGRFTAGEDAPSLITILFHVMQEYARHLGHLDVARELIDGATGES